MIAANTISLIKNRLDLVELISRYTRVSRRLKALCPFHSEKKPSLSIHPSKKYWKCFGCGLGGDCIRFYQLINGLTFSDSVALLAKEVGVDLPEDSRFMAYQKRKSERQQNQLLKVERLANSFSDLYRDLGKMLLMRRQRLPIRSDWDSWSAKDYLSEQLVDYKFDLLDQIFHKIELVLRGERRRVING